MCQAKSKNNSSNIKNVKKKKTKIIKNDEKNMNEKKRNFALNQWSILCMYTIPT